MKTSLAIGLHTCGQELRELSTPDKMKGDQLHSACVNRLEEEEEEEEGDHECFFASERILHRSKNQRGLSTSST